MRLVHDTTTLSKPHNSVAQALERRPVHLEVDLSNAIRLMGNSAANGDNNDPLILQGEAALGFRRIIARFGFDRMPFTYGEAQGLLDYCERLDAAAGTGWIEDAYLADWQQASEKVIERKHPHLLTALKLYCRGNIEELRALHKAEDTLTQLGKSFKEFSLDQ